MERLQGMPREQVAGWSDQRMEEVIHKLAQVKSRTPDQEALLTFLLDAATRRKENHDPLR